MFKEINMTLKEKKLLSKIHKYLYVPGVTNPCDIKAITDYINEAKTKLKTARGIIKILLYDDDTKEFYKEEFEELLNKLDNGL